MSKKLKFLGLVFLTLALVVGVGAYSANAALTLADLTIASDGALTLSSSINTSAITLGTTSMTTGATTIYGGTGTGAITLTPGTAGTIVVGAATGTGAITLGSSSGASQIVNVGTGSGATQTVNIGGGAGLNTINIGTGATGLETINIGNDASLVNAITIGGAASNLVLSDAQWSVTGSGAATFFTVNGNTITTGTGVLTLAAGNSLITSGAFAATLTSTATTNATLPAGTNTLYSTLAASITSAALLSSVSDETGTGLAVFGTSPTLTTPALGTPSALVLTSATGLPTAGILDAAVTYAKIQNISATSRVLGRITAGAGVTEELTGANIKTIIGAISLTADVSGILPTANGGTGIAFFTAAGPSAARIYTFPDAAATIARTDAGQTFTGVQTMTSPAITTPAFTGAFTGTYTVGGTPTIAAATWSGTQSGGGQQLNNVIIGTTTPLAGTFTTLTATTANTATNCSSNAAPAVCAAAPAGSVVIAAAGTTVTVNTTAVTANSQILVTEDASLGTKVTATCNTTAGRTYAVTARTAATSFVITTNAAPTTNPACLSYLIVN